MSDPRTRLAALPAGVLTALFAWWAWKQGAYFGPVFYPGAILVFALLALVLAFAPFDVRLDGPTRIALLALIGFAGLSLLSVLWSPTRAAAIEYGEHAALYAALFAFGIWIASMLRGRPLLALAPAAVAGSLVAIATVVVLATGTDVGWYLHVDATLRFPIGYRNADAAFFLICLWPLLGLAAWSEWGWPLRALTAAMGTLLVEVALLCQSRGSIPALAFAVVVYLAFAPKRLRAAAVIALVALPVLPALPALLDVFRHGDANPAIVPLLRDAARAIALTTVLSFGLGAVAFGVVQPRLRLGAARIRVISWVTATAAIALVVVGGAIFVSRHGGPVGFVDQRVSEFKKTGYPDLHRQGVRFGVNVGSDRHDFWRVGVEQGLDHPLAGGGAGSFYLGYVRNRSSPETPHDPHSVEVMAFSELGLLGLVLLVLFVGGATWAAVRARRLGSAAAIGASAAAIGGGAQWLLQASYDWFWQYPAVTGTAVFLLGVAAAPGLVPSAARGGTRAVRAIAIAAASIVALVAIPLFLSARYSRQAESEIRTEPGAALDDFERAAKLNPLSDQPLIAKGALAGSLGDRRLALKSFREATDREPGDYSSHWFIAKELVGVDDRAARAALREARRLNPNGADVEEVGEQLRQSGQ